MNLYTKQKQAHRHRKLMAVNLWLSKVGEGDKPGAQDELIQTAVN